MVRVAVRGYDGVPVDQLRQPHRTGLRARGRRPGVLEKAIGADSPGVLVSDLYTAYTSYGGRHQ